MTVSRKTKTISTKETVTCHEAVLLQETIDGLNLKNGDVFFDGTLGGGGHSTHVAKKFGQAVRIIAVDRDQKALARAKKRLQVSKANFSLYLSDYRNLDQILVKSQIKKVQAIILDLGLSSDQLEKSKRGFTFTADEPLLMTFADLADKPIVTAISVVNNWAESTLADIIYGYGDERYARRIARKIISARADQPIKTTNDLVEIIRQAVPASYRHGKIHFATKTFQALRMAVNDELGALKEGLEKGFEHLDVFGRMAVISFHSGEDRIVKNFYRDRVKENLAKLITKKPITASLKELDQNPRARSAKLRIIEKI